MEEIEDEDVEDLKYEFRKQFQKLERKHPSERLVLEQKKVLKNMSQEQRVHINPNKKTVFVKLNQIQNGYLDYLKQKFHIPIDYSFQIRIDNDDCVCAHHSSREFLDNIPSSLDSFCSFIDQSFEPSQSFLLQSLEPFLFENFD